MRIIIILFCVIVLFENVVSQIAQPKIIYVWTKDSWFCEMTIYQAYSDTIFGMENVTGIKYGIPKKAISKITDLKGNLYTDKLLTKEQKLYYPSTFKAEEMSPRILSDWGLISSSNHFAPENPHNYFFVSGGMCLPSMPKVFSDYWKTGINIGGGF